LGLHVLWRREFLWLRGRVGWLLVYGRRKTGKSFMVRLLAPWDVYITVSRDLAAVVEERGGGLRVVEPGDAVALAARRLEGGATVVVDEFHRLPPRYWQVLASRHPHGRLILVASSLGVLRRVFSESSPLLGLVEPLRVDPLAYADTVASLAPRLGARGAVLWGVLLREPWLTGLVGDYAVEPWRFIASSIQPLITIARSLIGEVFEEEERQLTRLYEAVLRLLGAGVWNTAKLAALLYQRGLLSSYSPGAVAGILDRMASMGLVAKTRLWRTRGAKVYYRHASPLLAIVYGVAERYAVDEVQPAPREAVEQLARSLYARELQFTLGELLAEYHGGLHAYTILPKGQGDVDIVILDSRGRRPLAAYEVKMGSCTTHDLKTLLGRAELVGAPRAGAVCLEGAEVEYPGVTVLDAGGIVRVAVSVVKRVAASMASPTAPSSLRGVP
jgi:hypothetical protein